MATQKTPGIWEEIPTGAVVTATWKDQTIKGTLEKIYQSGTDAHKCMELRAAPFGIVTLDARDHWDVTYESRSLADVIKESPIGSVFRSRLIQVIKVSETYIVTEDLETQGYQIRPELVQIDQLESRDPANFTQVYTG